MQKFSFIAQKDDLALRLDKLLVHRFPDYTRSFLQKLFKDGHVLVDSKPVKARFMILEGQKVDLLIPDPKSLELKPNKDIKLDIVYEDKNILVVNKPAGLVTHPGVGESHLEDSLVNAVLYHCKGKLSGISGVMRPGIVHRLDKDTSGLIVVAKTDKAHQALAQQLKDRKVEKTYYALLAGHLTPEKGRIEAPIGRSHLNRKKMAVTTISKGRQAITQYEVLDYFKMNFLAEAHYTLVEIHLITGRTHQIRVHFASISQPLIGDPLYGREKVNHLFSNKFGLKRQFLHAGEISFILPGTTKKVTFKSPLPGDLDNVLKGLRSSKA